MKVEVDVVETFVDVRWESVSDGNDGVGDAVAAGGIGLWLGCGVGAGGGGVGGKDGVESKVGVVRFVQSGSWICAVEMS